MPSPANGLSISACHVRLRFIEDIGAGALPVHVASLIAGLVVTGLYYFAALLVWPEDGDNLNQ